MDTDIYLAADRLPLVQDIGWNLSEERYTHPDRRLAFDVFVFVVSGRMQVIEEGVEYWIGPGEHLFLKNGAHHYGLPRSDPGTGWYWIHFRTPGLDAEAYEGAEPLPGLDFYYPEHYRYRLALPKHGSTPWHVIMAQRLEQLLRQSRDRSLPHRMTWLSVQTHAMFLELQRAAASTTSEVAQGKAASLPGRVMSYLRQHACEELDATQLSAELQLNYSYISATFSRLTGQTIVQAHTKLRVEQAIALMRDTSLNIGEIAKRVGYANPFYFSRIFKKTMGESPSSYLNHFYRT
ncbi:helix-turn-helix domain-containing protein [Paenibacillus daejeonensis]|uniref:helix-turn-helix domain-containing protein n=1 Tax=Paenibacillus daejeonensis TaxID=135193 RepID=UPI0003784B69|nr:AraC family transcriptional regulator [Paenibacillus daejeonensis]